MRIPGKRRRTSTAAAAVAIATGASIFASSGVPPAANAASTSHETTSHETASHNTTSHKTTGHETAGLHPGPMLQTFAFSSLGRQATGRQATGATVLPARDTQPFSMLGVTWTNPALPLGAAVEVRARDLVTHRWGAWHTMESDGPASGDRRGATDPLWVGESDGVQARVAGTHGVLPPGLRVDLINPDDLPSTAAHRKGANAVRTLGKKAANQEPTTGYGRKKRGRREIDLPARPVPRMMTRTGWRANESIVRAAPSYTGPVQVFFVHHTATGNAYSCTDSPAIVRGIQAYQVKSRGWDDIGYNFLVDKCGNLFEGRGGGVGRSVLGAHTLGFNTDASAIAVIGNYDNVGASRTVLTKIATVAAYKLGAAGHPPDGRVVLVSGGGPRFAKGERAALYRISGHRDAGETDCPGDALYRQLPQIRAIAGAAPVGLRFLHMAGARKLGGRLYTRGAVKLLWNVSTPSALISRFEIGVDGTVWQAVPGTHRTAVLSLPKGGHSVSVRAIHLSGRSETIASKVVSDGRPPDFTHGPDLELRTGPLEGTVPVRLTWTATDVNGITDVRMVRPSDTDLGTTAHAKDGTLRPTFPATFVLRATDRAGNSTDASITRTPVIVSEAETERTGVWRTLQNENYLGGVALGSVEAGATATWKVTGRAVGLAVAQGLTSGRVRVTVDGHDEGLIDLHADDTVYRRMVWSHSWDDSADHTVTVEVAGSGAILDGLVVLK